MLLSGFADVFCKSCVMPCKSHMSLQLEQDLVAVFTPVCEGPGALLTGWLCQYYLDVLGSSTSTITSWPATDANSIPSLCGESDIRRSCRRRQTHTCGLVARLCNIYRTLSVMLASLISMASSTHWLLVLTCLLKSALICSSKGSVSLHHCIQCLCMAVWTIK